MKKKLVKLQVIKGSQIVARFTLQGSDNWVPRLDVWSFLEENESSFSLSQLSHKYG